MKKILITLSVILVALLFIGCNADAVGAFFGSQDSPVCFTALTDNSEVKLEISYLSDPKLKDYKDLPQVVNFLYSRDNSTWADYTIGTPITLAKNDKVYFKAKEKVSGLNGRNEYHHFTTDNGQVSVKGNVMYLLNPSGESVEMADYAFASLFYGNTALVSAKDLLLPAAGLKKGCYFQMFMNCTALTECPELKATELAISCYHSMFQGCSSLTIAPELPATTLADHCYEAMFWKCTSLTTAPVLPANTLAQYCYQYMFEECTSLTTAPVLPTNTLANSCYASMFKGCSALNSVTMLAENISATDCLKEWLKNTTGGTLKVANDAMKTTLSVHSETPSGWTVEVNP